MNMKKRFILGVALCALCANVLANEECALYEARTENPGHGGSVSAEQSLSNDCEWVITATPASGYSFAGWNDGVTTNPRTITIDTEENSISYTATFIPVTYDNPATGGTVKAEPVAGTCNWIITATPAEGYAFLSWSDDDITNPRTLTDADITAQDSYTATFIQTDAAIDGWTSDKVVVRTKKVDLDGVTATIYTDATQRATDLTLTEKDHGYWSIPASLNTYAGEPLKIIFYCGGNPVSVIDSVVPYVVSANTNISSLTLPANTDVQVVSGTLTMNAASSAIAALDIYPDAKAVVPSGKTLAVSAIYMRANAMEDKYPQLVANGSITNTSGKIYYDYALDYNNYYPLAVPYQVSCSNIITHTGKQASFEIQWYDGAERAISGEGWTVLDDQAAGAHLNPGQGYIVFAVPYKWNGVRQSRVTLRFPMTADLSAGELQKSAPISLYEGTITSNNNWNYLGNPYLAAYTSSSDNMMMTGYYTPTTSSPEVDNYTYVDDGLRYLTTSSDYFRTYTQSQAAEGIVIKPFNTFFIQSAVTGNLTFALSQRAQNMPRRIHAEDMSQEIAFGLILQSANSVDRTGLLYGETFTDDYEMNADLVKLSGSNAVLEFYSLAQNEKRAFNALPAQEMLRPVQLGFRNAQAGEMNIAFDSAHYNAEPLSAVILTDRQTGQVVNLLEGEYRFSSASAKDDARFAVHAVRAPFTTTGLNDQMANDSMTNGIYDLVGRRITSDILPRGIYIIVENGRSRKVVIQ